MAINRIFGAISLTQGTGALTNIESLVLNDNDIAIARSNSNELTGGHDAEDDGICFYRWEASRSGSPTDTIPYIVKPDNLDAGNAGRWLLISPTHFMENLVVEPNSAIIVNEIVGHDSGLIIGYSTAGSVLSVPIQHVGTGFTNGSYTNEPTSTVGDGTGLTVDLVVAGGVIITATVNQGGTGYIKNDLITIDNFANNAELKVGSVDNISIKILDDEIQMHHLTRFFEQATFEVTTGAPFTVLGNQTLVDDLNVEFHGGEPIDNISLLDDNTNKYSVLPQVTNPSTVVPSVDADLVTVKYMMGVLDDGSAIDHASLTALDLDDHLQYIRVSGDRGLVGFTGVISGQYPTLTDHLTTKAFVDDSINALGLGVTGDYLRRDGTTTATDSIFYESSVDFAELDAGSGQKLSSVAYVKTSITNHNTEADPHTQYLRNDGDDATVGRISSIPSVTGNQLTIRSEIDSYLIDLYTNMSSSDGYLDVTATPFESNIVRKDHPSSNPLLYTRSQLEGSSENLVNYGYLAVRLLNLLEFDNTIDLGQVVELTVSTPSTGYVVGDTFSPTGGSGSGLVVTVGMIGAGGTLLSVVIDDAGDGYVRNEILNIVGGAQITLTEVVLGAIHGDLLSLDVDDHIQYILADSTRAFDNSGGFYPRVTHSGVVPTAGEHLTTKAYVDSVVGAAGTVSSVNSIIGAVDIYQNLGVISTHPNNPSAGLSGGGTTFATSTPFHQIPFLSSSTFASHLSDPVSDYTTGYQLTSKAYVDFSVSELSSDLLGAVLTTGENPLLNNQIYVPKYHHDYFVENQDGQDESNELVNKGYVDSYLGMVLNSDNDGYMSFLSETIVPAGWTSTLDTTLNDGTTTAIIVENRYALQGGITRVEIMDGGSGFFVIDSGSVSYPQTIGTGSTTNNPTFDAAGTNSTYTETNIELDESGNTTADIRINKVIGDVGIIEIQNAGTGYLVGEEIGFSGDGKGAVWEITTIGGSGEITGVQRNTAQTTPYTFITGYVINTAGGSGAILKEYLVGEIVSFNREDVGTGYLVNEYRYALGSAVDDGFTWSGYGTTTGDTDDSGIDVIFVNARDEKIYFNHYGNATLSGNVGASPFTVTTGNIINSISFDEWGHITNISQAGTPFGVWVEIDDTDSPFTTTRNYSYFVDVSSGVVELRLAATPSLGDTIMIDDIQENSSTNNITVNDSVGGNLLVAGSSATPTEIDVDGVRIILIYVNATYGWRLKTI